MAVKAAGFDLISSGPSARQFKLYMRASPYDMPLFFPFSTDPITLTDVISYIVGEMIIRPDVSCCIGVALWHYYNVDIYTLVKLLERLLINPNLKFVSIREASKLVTDYQRFYEVNYKFQRGRRWIQRHSLVPTRGRKSVINKLWYLQQFLWVGHAPSNHAWLSAYGEVADLWHLSLKRIGKLFGITGHK